jgi:hypothetical protein
MEQNKWNRNVEGDCCALAPTCVVRQRCCRTGVRRICPGLAERGAAVLARGARPCRLAPARAHPALPPQAPAQRGCERVGVTGTGVTDGSEVPTDWWRQQRQPRGRQVRRISCIAGRSAAGIRGGRYRLGVCHRTASLVILSSQPGVMDHSRFICNGLQSLSIVVVIDPRIACCCIQESPREPDVPAGMQPSKVPYSGFA